MALTNNTEPVVIEMDTNEFIRIQDNPRQRDTERHAVKAAKTHLAKPSPTHRSVSVATINGVPVCKEDGHTRAYLWSKGKLSKPTTVLATCYPVSTMEEAADLYTHFDNQLAVEGSSDRLFGACRESSLSLNSQLLRRFDFATALKCAHYMRTGATSRAMMEYELIDLWRGPLKVIDDWNLNKNRFKGSGIVSFALIAVASKSFADDTLSSFFIAYNNDAGKKDGSKRDGVQALSEHMEYRRFQNLMTGFENIYDMMSKSYSCLRAWSEGQMIQNVQPSNEALIKLHAKARAIIDAKKF